MTARPEGSGLRVYKPWTMESVRARCDEVGVCLIWRLAVDECGRPVAHMTGSHRSVRRFVYEAGGGLIRTAYYPVPRCGDKRCLSHLICVPRGRINSDSRARSLLTPGNWAKHQQRGHYAKLNPELAAAIRNSDEPEEVLAERHGVKVRAVRRIKAGETWKPMPIATSVFNFGATL